MQKHLRLSLDELKARLISEEGILKSKEPEPSHPPKRPFTPQHDRSPQFSKPVHLNAGNHLPTSNLFLVSTVENRTFFRSLLEKVSGTKEFQRAQKT
jgi:hypothetical protein